MKFPSLEELATTHVLYIDISATIKEAIALMLRNEHRNIIVKDGTSYRILMISKVVYIKKRGMNQNLTLAELHLPKVAALSKTTNILKCVEYINGHIEYVCTLHSDGSLHGIITLTDIISHIDPDTLIENYTLKEYLYLGTTIMQADPQENVLDIFDKFEHSHFDSVVITQDEYPIGILTAKDILKALKNNHDLNIQAQEWGGEEFVVLLPTANLDEAYKLAIKIQHNIKALQFEKDIGELTIRVGVAPCLGGEELESIVARADKALYEAKDSGKDCIRVSRLV